MKVFVTGGAGFIGSHVAEFYAQGQNEVVVFDNLSRGQLLGRNTSASLYNWSYLKDKYSNIKVIKGDVRNCEETLAAAQNVDVIIHAAAQVAVTTSLIDPWTDLQINAMGTLNVLEAARQNDATLVFCSTNKVYGENVNGIAVKEGAKFYSFDDEKYKNGIPETFSIDMCGHSPYGCSKLAADLYAQDYAHTYGLRTGVFRMSCIYGVRQFGVEDQGWISWFIIATLTGKRITVFGDGKQVRDVLYITDLVKAYNAFINSKMKNEVFNIGGGSKNTLSVAQSLELLKNLTGKIPEISFADWRRADQKVYVSDISKAEKLLNWKPRVKPEEGVVKIVDWVSANLELFRQQ